MPPEMRSRRRATLRPRKSSNDVNPILKKKVLVKKKLKKVPAAAVKKSKKKVSVKKKKCQVAVKKCQVKMNLLSIHNPTRFKKNIVFHSGSSRFICVDDDDGHLNFNLGDVLIERYKLNGFLGKGTFGRVARALDLQTRDSVAVKIIKNDDTCRESGKAEIEIMRRLNRIDPRGKNRWVKMLDYFEFWGHVFIVFEMLGEDLYTFMRDIDQPYLLSQIKHIAYQLIKSVNALHNNLLVHTDLKPENICFVNSDDIHGSYSLRHRSIKYVKDSTIRLIDFGSTIHLTDPYRGIIQTRHYRCPEVIFGMRWSYASDVWSIGCILFELYTGMCLFLINTDEDHIRAMEETLGPMPPFFKNTQLGRRVEKSKLTARKMRRTFKPLRKYMRSTSVEHLHFFDFLEKCFHYDPLFRFTLDAALNHPFISSLPHNLRS